MFRLNSTGQVLCALTVSLCAAAGSMADPFLVVTQGASAQHVPTGTYIHGVDLDIGQSTGGVLISDHEWSYPLSFNHDLTLGASVGLMQTVRSTPHALNSTPYPVLVNLAPLRTIPSVYSTKGVVVAHFWGYDSERDQHLLCTVYRYRDGGRLEYRIGKKTITVPLSGIPQMAVPSPNGNIVAIMLRTGTDAHFSVQLCGLSGKRRIGKAIPLVGEGQRFGVEARGMLISKSGRYVYTAFSGYALGEPDGERSSWVEAIDRDTSKRLSKSLSIEGTLDQSNASLVPGIDDSCWVVSYTAGRSYGFASNIAIENDSLASRATLTYSGADSSIHVDVDPDEQYTSIGVGKTVVIYDEKRSPYKSLSFDDTVTALYWSHNGLMLGFGDRVVRVNPDTGDQEVSLALPSGIVTQILPHPNPEHFRTASYGVTSSRWVRSIVFREDQAGLEHFAIGSPGAAMKVASQGATTLPSWLQINPPDHEDVGYTLSIDSEDYSRTPGSVRSMMLPLLTMMPNGGDENSLTKTLFRVSVDSAHYTDPSILWVRDPEEYPKSILSSDPSNPFARVIAHLEEYPLSYTHHEISEAGPVDIEAHTAVVLTSVSAGYGLFTRQDLLDYLSGGGTLLYMAHATLPVVNDRGGRWLEALGMQVDTTSRVNGVYASDTQAGFMRHWKGVQIDNGMAIDVADKNSILSSGRQGGGTVVAVERTYGLGRVIAFASATPFENDSLNDPHALRLVEGIFRRIVDASIDRSDLDGDGIPDRIEDVNRNRKHDPGETHFAIPDTDGDGILDGIEDHNQNGFVDDIETSPLLSDTDSDGIPDAADRYPLPPSGAPYIASIDPSSMPAEGSRRVLIEGRNFTQNSQVWFGDRISPETRLLTQGQLEAVVPPRVSNDPNVTDVEIRDSDFSVASTLENGFRYEPRGNVRMVLQAINHVRIQYGVYQLTLRAVLGDFAVGLDEGSVIVEASPSAAIESLDIQRGDGMSNDQEGIRVDVLEKGRLRVTLDGATHFDPAGSLFEIQCRVNMLIEPATHFQFRVVEKHLRTPFQGVVDSLDETSMSYDFGSSTQIPLFEDP